MNYFRFCAAAAVVTIACSCAWPNSWEDRLEREWPSASSELTRYAALRTTPRTTASVIDAAVAELDDEIGRLSGLANVPDPNRVLGELRAIVEAIPNDTLSSSSMAHVRQIDSIQREASMRLKS